MTAAYIEIFMCVNLCFHFDTFISLFLLGVGPAAKPSPGTPTTPTSNLGGAVKTPVQSASNPLANILSKVEITPESILSALSKTQVPSTPNLQGRS